MRINDFDGPHLLVIMVGFLSGVQANMKLPLPILHLLIAFEDYWSGLALYFFGDVCPCAWLG